MALGSSNDSGNAAYVYTGSVWFKISAALLMQVSCYFPQSLQAGVISW
jgi:hypothetical protein